MHFNALDLSALIFFSALKHLRLRLSESLSEIELWFVTVTVVYKSKLRLTTTSILNHSHGVSVPFSPLLVGLLLALRD